jgi:hypothetical protein
MDDNINLLSNDSIGILVVDAMHIAEADKSMIGSDKKVFVLQTIKTVIGLEKYERYYPLLDVLIDLIVSISRKDIELYLNKTKKFCLPLFSCVKK